MLKDRLVRLNPGRHETKYCLCCWYVWKMTESKTELLCDLTRKITLNRAQMNLIATSFLSGQFTAKAIMNPPDGKLVNSSSVHSWAKFKIVLVRKPGRKFYYFMAKFQGSGFSFQSLNQNIKVVVFPSNFWFQKFKVVVFPSNFWIPFFKVVVFPSNFWNITIIWWFSRVILNFAQECHYLEKKVGIVDFTNTQGNVLKPKGPPGPSSFENFTSPRAFVKSTTHTLFSR